MAKKTKKSTSDVEENLDLKIGSREFFDELIKGTEFKIANEGALMTNRPKTPTPLAVLNCIFGEGIPMAVQMEVSGLPAGGKSTFAYGMMGMFQQKYGDHGVAVVLDIEDSLDEARLRQFGVDTSRVLRLPSLSLEKAFENMFKMFSKVIAIKEQTKQDIHLFIVYDSLDAGGTDKQHESIDNGGSAMTFGGGMMEKPRILKQNTASVTRFLEQVDAVVCYLNQVQTKGIGSYITTVDSGGGFGKDHNMHIKLQFGAAKDDKIKEGDIEYIVGTKSYVKITKNKVGPKFNQIPCYIDVRKLGVIDEVKSFMLYLTEGNYIKQAGGWYQFTSPLEYMIENFGDYLDKDNLEKYIDHKYREKDIIDIPREDRDLYYLLQVFLIEKITDVYPANSLNTNTYRQSLINACGYFTNKEVPVRELENNQLVDLSDKLVEEDEEE